MLVVENNSVYEIDEECLKRRNVPKECEVYQKIVREREQKEQKQKQGAGNRTVEKTGRRKNTDFTEEN
jgi:hypothetical protein